MMLERSCLPVLLVALSGAASAQVSNHLVSANTAGSYSSESCSGVALSDDGRFATFGTRSNDLVKEIAATNHNVFLRDIASGETVMASVAYTGTEEGNASSFYSSVSNDGKFVVWLSTGTNFTATPPTDPGLRHAYLRNMDTGVTVQIDRATSNSTAGESIRAYVTPDGQYVLLRTKASFDPADTNGFHDAYRYEVATGSIVPISVTSSGAFGASGVQTCDISNDGRFVVFSSSSPDLGFATPGGAQIFVKDMETGELTWESRGAQDPTQSNSNTYPSISGDGSTIAFNSTASDLVAGDSNNGYDIIVRDLATGAMELAALDTAGNQVAGMTWLTYLDLNFDGRFLLFEARSSNLVPNDTNGSEDVFMRDRVAGTTARVGLAFDGSELPDGCGVSSSGGNANSISRDGQRYTLRSFSPGLVEGVAPPSGRASIYVQDLLQVGVAGAVYCDSAANSTGYVGVIGAGGSTRLSDNDIQLTAHYLPPQSFGFFVTSLTTAYVPQAGGSTGTLCVAGAIGRFVGPGQVQDSGAEGRFSLALDLLALPSPTGSVSAVAGETRHFQAWTRDAVMGAATSNFTNAVSVELR